MTVVCVTGDSLQWQAKESPGISINETLSFSDCQSLEGFGFTSAGRIGEIVFLCLVVKEILQ